MAKTKKPDKVPTKPARTIIITRPKKAPSKTRRLSYK